MYLCVWVCARVQVPTGPEKASKPVDRELQIVLGTKSGSRVRAESALNGRTISPAFLLLGIFLRDRKTTKPTGSLIIELTFN